MNKKETNMINLADVSIDSVTGKYVLRIGKVTTNSYKYQLCDPIERYCRNRESDMCIEFTNETIYETKDELESELLNIDYGEFYIFTSFIKEYDVFTAYFGANDFITEVLDDL